MAMAMIKIKLRMFPTPKYLRIKNKDRDIEIRRPLREFAKRRDDVKSRAEKVSRKNKGTIKKVFGSTK